MKTPLGTEVDLGTCHTVRRDPAPPRKCHSSPSLFGSWPLWPRSPILATAEFLLVIITVNLNNIANHSRLPPRHQAVGIHPLKNKYGMNHVHCSVVLAIVLLMLPVVNDIHANCCTPFNINITRFQRIQKLQDTTRCCKTFTRNVVNTVPRVYAPSST